MFVCYWLCLVDTSLMLGRDNPLFESEGEGESVTQENNTESEVSSSVDEGNVITIPSGISVYYNKLQSRVQQHSSVEEPLKLQTKVPKAFLDSGFVI